MEKLRKNITYAKYFDKVYGCFLGKCIGGTAGGPAEGRKELLDFPLNEELLHQTLPNDDLDLQILWLELIESVGFDITSRDMAREFYEKVPYGPGEYAYFEKNYAHGVYPPTSGRYNNRYYKNGMGCPIRAEIWACIFPGSNRLIGKYVEMDGSLDHERDSIDAERFLAVFESELFFDRTLREALDTALDEVPADSKLGRVLRDTVGWYDEGLDWKLTRGKILRSYGHADCTNMYQNLGFILIALLYGQGDFRRTIQIGLACGYDTDCICATAASILGIIRGADKLLNTDGMSDTGLDIAVKTRRRKGTIEALARDVCVVGMSASEKFDDMAMITEMPEFARVPDIVRTPPVTLTVNYHSDPVLSPDCATELGLAFYNTTDTEIELTADFTPPEDVMFTPRRISFSLKAGERREFDCRAELSPGAVKLRQTNIFSVTMDTSAGRLCDDFGLVGCDIWYRYGPFLENIKDLSDLAPHEPYGKHFKLLPDENGYDVTREYHLGGIADINHEFVPECEPFCDIKPDDRAECVPERVAIGEDLFDTAELQPYEGAHVDYLLRRMISPEDRTVEVAVGHTAPFKLWVNGRLVGMSDRTKWWTLENMHFTVKLERGVNTVILKCAQQSDHAKYSLVWRIQGGRWRQYTDFESEL